MKWEMFKDCWFYDMWAVRPEGDKDFNSLRLFHFVFEKDAIDFLILINKAHVAEEV